jgi:hypothetical protein
MVDGSTGVEYIQINKRREKMTKTEAKELAAAAHANLHSRLDGIEVRLLDLSWSQEKCKEQRDLAFVQYSHTLDSIMFQVNA